MSLMVISQFGKIIRIDTKSVRSAGHSTQGVKLLDLEDQTGGPHLKTLDTTGCPIFATVLSSIRWAIFAAAKIPIHQNPDHRFRHGRVARI
jgi:hypothetical protein